MTAPHSESRRQELDAGKIGIAASILAALIALIVFWDQMPWADQGNPDDPRNKFSEDLVAQEQALFDLHDQALQAAAAARAQAAAAQAQAAAARLKASEEFDSYVDVRLREHDARLTIARKELGEAVAAYFEERKGGIPAYAEDALTWKNRWTALWDSEKFRKKLDDLFAQHVLTSSGMAESIGRAVEGYLGRVDAEERSLVADLRLKASALPALGLEASLDEAAFQRLIDNAVTENAAKVTGSSQKIVGGAVGISLVAGLSLAFVPGTAEVAAVAAAPIGAAYSQNGLVKILVNEFIELILSYVKQAFLSEDEIESSALRLLDDLKVVLMKGTDEAMQDFGGLEELLRKEKDPETRQRAIDLMNHMRNSGQLGLDALLNYIQDRNAAHKRQVFKSLGATP